MPGTVLIVDDHPEFRVSARALLEADGYEVVGEAEDGASALRLVEELRPAVVLLDIALPDLDGFAVADQLATHGEPPAVVLVSSREGSSYGPRLTDARVRGFVSKRHLSGATLAALVG